jgi:hypothetical protein
MRPSQIRARNALRKRYPPMAGGPCRPRWRTALGYTLVALHALYMLTLLPSAWYPLWVQVAMFAVVVVPMVALRGACWLSRVERWLLMERLPSMTIRLTGWLTCGYVVLDKRSQWWVLAGIPVVAFVPRLWT